MQRALWKNAIGFRLSNIVKGGESAGKAASGRNCAY
ncbi:MAG: hypothetical protein JWQ10_2337 [Herbaspirillum sp.]|nr:hypothetical protein [Herbaspirillum sp.]